MVQSGNETTPVFGLQRQSHCRGDERGLRRVARTGLDVLAGPDERTSLPTGGESAKSAGAGGWLVARGRAPTPAEDGTGRRSIGREALKKSCEAQRLVAAPPRILGHRCDRDSPGETHEA
ncbi:hypothetical protein NDU88_003445 [Pleurodeles waltl]|uniref:Uncharacterized protein n=1 Tax=Pleurodeles waltl TaxID=8319 RepID=A0AAV7MRU8_PLEWA|nr:hypothetical protein NDU88_003445 [Pleurodeles waltl]